MKIKNKEIKEIKTELKEKFKNADKERIVLILNKNGKLVFKEITNISDMKPVHYIGQHKEYFEVLKDTQFLSDKPKWMLIGIAHNHPFHEAIPSQTDLENWFYDILYFIYSNKTDELKIYEKGGRRWNK